jgi:hypothetical protein
MEKSTEMRAAARSSAADARDPRLQRRFHTTKTQCESRGHKRLDVTLGQSHAFSIRVE